jgi:L-type amino acid transporter 5
MYDGHSEEGVMAEPSAEQSSPVTSDSSSATGSETVRLKRNLGLFNGISLIVGVIVGSGIFVSPKGVLIESGSVGAALLVWIICGVICLIGALCMAELGTLITSSGGMYAYIQTAFGDFAGFVYLWTAMLVIFPAANAVIALACGYYILQPLFPCGAPDSAARLIAAVAIAFLTFVNCVSVKVSCKIQNVFTVIKTLALVVVIITGIVALVQGRIENFENMFEGSTKDPGRVALAFYSGMFSYSGWYTLNFLTEELKNPYKNLPRAIWISMPLVTVIYVLVNVAYFAVLTAPEIIASEAVAVSFADRMFGLMAWTMPIFVAFSCFGSLNGCILSVSRMFFVGSREGHLPIFLSLINVNKFTPVPAVMFEGIFSILLLFISGDLYLLINCVSFVEALSFLVCTIILLIYKRKNIARPNENTIRVHISLPIIFATVCLFLVLFPLFLSPKETLMGIFFMVSGIPAYGIGVMWKNKPAIYKKYIKSFTILTQKLIVGVPEDSSKMD